MRVIFFGSPRFADIVLRRLLAADQIPVALVANPDRPVGRKHLLTSPPTVTLVRDTRAEHSIEILQPDKLDEDFAARCAALTPDLFIIAAYAKIIPAAILAIPRLGTLGVHPSLLPALRGASPIQSAILTGVATTGVTLYEVDEKMDHGPIYAQETLVDIDLETTIEPDLEARLAELAGTLLIATLPRIMAGGIVPSPQDHTIATFTKKFTTEDAYIPFAELDQAEHGANGALAHALSQKIRAFVIEPGAWTTLPENRRVKLLDATVEHDTLRITRLQREGEKARPWSGPLSASSSG